MGTITQIALTVACYGIIFLTIAVPSYLGWIACSLAGIRSSLKKIAEEFED